MSEISQPKFQDDGLSGREFQQQRQQVQEPQHLKNIDTASFTSSHSSSSTEKFIVDSIRSKHQFLTAFLPGGLQSVYTRGVDVSSSSTATNSDGGSSTDTSSSNVGGVNVGPISGTSTSEGAFSCPDNVGHRRIQFLSSERNISNPFRRLWGNSNNVVNCYGLFPQTYAVQEKDDDDNKRTHRIVIVGAGLYGLMSAYYLTKHFRPSDETKKLHITILDRELDECRVASRLNGGALCFGLVKSWANFSNVFSAFREKVFSTVRKLSDTKKPDDAAGVWCDSPAIHPDDGPKIKSPDMIHVGLDAFTDIRFLRFVASFLWNGLFNSAHNDHVVMQLAKLSCMCCEELEKDLGTGTIYDQMSVRKSSNSSPPFKGTLMVNVSNPTEVTSILKREGAVSIGRHKIAEECPVIDEKKLVSEVMIHFPGDRQGECAAFGKKLRAWLENHKRGQSGNHFTPNIGPTPNGDVTIDFRFGCEVTKVHVGKPEFPPRADDLADASNKPVVETSSGRIDYLEVTQTTKDASETRQVYADSYVLASGADLGFFVRKHKLMWNLPIYPLHGCVIDCKAQCDLKHAVMIGGIAGLVVPLSGDRLRISAGVAAIPSMHCSKEKSPFDTQRIRDYLLQHFKIQGEVEELENHICARPVIADDVPVIGTLGGYENAYLCGGGGSKGWTLVPACGALLGAIMLEDIQRNGSTDDKSSGDSKPASKCRPEDLWQMLSVFFEEGTVRAIFSPKRFDWW